MNMKQLFGGLDFKDIKEGSGHAVIPKSKIVASKDPMQIRAEIAELYTKAVQDHPEIDFGIVVDPHSDDIKITWSKRKD
jgi:hypothetical protein